MPTVAPSFYERFPADFRVIFGSSITSAVIVAFVLNLVFNHWSWRSPPPEIPMNPTQPGVPAQQPNHRPY